MESTLTPAAPPPAARVRRLEWKTWLSVVGVLLYAGFLARYMGAYASGSDSSGYLNNARMLAQGRVTIPMRIVPGLGAGALPSYAYVPLGFLPNDDHATLTPTYPTGLPLLFMGVSKVVGWEHGPGLTMGLHALFGLWLVYRLARAMGLESGWAGLGTVLLAASPLYIFLSLYTMSDVPAMVWVTAAVYFAWISRDQPWLALPAGMALGIAVLVRPTNLLAMVPVALALGLFSRRWLWLILGGLPAAIFLGAFNQAAYGRILTTGYGSVAAEFNLAVVPMTLRHYAIWLPVVLTPFVVLALGLPALARRQPRLICLLTVWSLLFAVFYVSNIHTHEFWWYLRFLLPAFPPLIVSTLLVANALIARFHLPLRRWWLVLAGALVMMNGAAWSRYLHAYTIGHGEKVYPQVADWLQTHLPANAVVATMQASGALFYYTDYPLVRWDFIAPADFQRIARACAAAGRPFYAVLYPFEIEDWKAFEQHLTGHWSQVGAVRHVSIWRLDSFDAPP
jgi:hypothetical protein